MSGVLVFRRGSRLAVSGGDKTVAKRLEALGFKVLKLTKLDWTRDEIILACQLVETNGLEASRSR